jgi:hypothetical protein
MTDTKAAGGGRLRMLQSMLRQAREYLAIEPDSNDRKAIEEVIRGLINLIEHEGGETDTTTVTSVNAANGKSTTRRLLVLPEYSQARFDEAARRLIETDLDAEYELEMEHPDELVMTRDERRKALKAEAKAINDELIELSDIDPAEQDRRAHAILAEFGMLDSQGANL